MRSRRVRFKNDCLRGFTDADVVESMDTRWEDDTVDAGAADFMSDAVGVCGAGELVADADASSSAVAEPATFRPDIGDVDTTGAV